MHKRLCRLSAERSPCRWATIGEVIMAAGFEADNVWCARGRGFQLAAIQPEGVTIHLTGQVA